MPGDAEPPGAAGRSELRAALWRSAVKLGEGWDGAGQPMAWTLDCREVLFTSGALPLVGELLWPLVRRHHPDAVGGMTMSADPMTLALLHQAAADGTPLSGFSVRKSPKEYGLRKLVEGPPLGPGRRVVLVDDVVSSGRSLERAYAAVTATGAEVVAGATLVDFARPAAVRRWARIGLPVERVFTVAELGLGPQVPTGCAHLRPLWTKPGMVTAGRRVLQPSPIDDPARDRLIVAGDRGFVVSATWAGKDVWRRSWTGGPVRAGPVLCGSAVIVGDLRGTVRCLDADSGGVRWTCALPGRIAVEPAADPRTGLLLVAGDGPDGSWIARLDGGTGAPGWRRALPAPPTARPTPDGTSGQVVVGLGDGSVHALDLDSGDTRWVAGTGGEVRGRPAIVGRTVVLGGYTGHAQALDLESGQSRWRTRLADWLVCCPVPVGACLLVGADRRVVALDPDTGAIAWVAPVAGRVLGGVVAVPGGFVVAASEGGDLAVLDPVDGRVAAGVRVGGPVRATPAVHGNRVAVPAADGDLRVFAVEAG